MFKGKRILAVVPARGGSKGVPLKNLREVCGRSLIAWVGDVVQNVQCIDRAVVSTDHDGIAAEAEISGIAAPFRRPEHLAGDCVGDIDVLKHALTTMEALDGVQYDVILMLQPTSPSRRPEHILQALTRLFDNDYDAVWSVTETDLKAHPLKQLVIDEKGRLGFYDPRGAGIVARQQLSPTYHRNGIVYAIKRNCLLGDVWLPENASAIIVTGPVVNIDTERDLESAKEQLEKNSDNIFDHDAAPK